MPVAANLVEHQLAFADLVNGFDFTLPGKDASLGRDIAVGVAETIIERTVADAQAADGSPLKPNEARYAARKARKYGVTNVGIGATGQMLSLQSVLGEVTIEPDAVSLRYGTGQQPTKTVNSQPLPAHNPSDREKAQFFTDGGRPFYQATGAVYDAAREIARESLDEYFRDH